MPQNRTASIEFEVGIGLFSLVRDFLNKCKFDGMKIEFIEYSGWLSRKFAVKGNLDDIISIDKTLKKLNNF